MLHQPCQPLMLRCASGRESPAALSFIFIQSIGRLGNTFIIISTYETSPAEVASLRCDTSHCHCKSTYLYEEDHLLADPRSPLPANKPICIDRLSWRLVGRAAQPPSLSSGSGVERHPDGSLKSPHSQRIQQDPRPLIGASSFRRFFTQGPSRGAMATHDGGRNSLHVREKD